MASSLNIVISYLINSNFNRKKKFVVNFICHVNFCFVCSNSIVFSSASEFFTQCFVISNQSKVRNCSYARILSSRAFKNEKICILTLRGVSRAGFHENTDSVLIFKQKQRNNCTTVFTHKTFFLKRKIFCVADKKNNNVECHIHSNQALPDTEIEKLCIKCCFPLSVT